MGKLQQICCVLFKTLNWNVFQKHSGVPEAFRGPHVSSKGVQISFIGPYLQNHGKIL